MIPAAGTSISGTIGPKRNLPTRTSRFTSALRPLPWLLTRDTMLTQIRWGILLSKLVTNTRHSEASCFGMFLKLMVSKTLVPGDYISTRFALKANNRYDVAIKGLISAGSPPTTTTSPSTTDTLLLTTTTLPPTSAVLLSTTTTPPSATTQSPAITPTATTPPPSGSCAGVSAWVDSADVGVSIPNGFRQS